MENPALGTNEQDYLGITSKWTQVYSGSYYNLVNHFAFSTDICRASGHAEPIFAPLGGMILSMRRGRRVFVDILNNNGYNVCDTVSIKIDTIRNIFWCPNGYIGALDYNGSIHIISAYGDLLDTIPFPTGAQTTVIVARNFNYGIAYISEQYEIMVFDYDSNCIVQAGKLDGKLQPILIDYSPNAGTGVIVMETREVFLFNLNGDIKPFTKLNVDPSFLTIQRTGKAFAVIGSGKVIAYQTMGKGLLSFGFDGPEPTNVAFLDEDCLVASNGKSTLIAHFALQSLRKLESITNVAYICSDLDGVRIYGDDVWSFTRVPKALLDIARLSANPMIKKLIDANQEYMERDIHSYEIITENLDRLEPAVNKILAAVIHINEWDVAERLLKAAAFAKCWLTNFDHDNFARVIKRMRILINMRRAQNAIEGNQSGYSLLTTGAEYEAADKVQLSFMFAQMRLFDLAEFVAKVEGITDNSHIAMAWAQMSLSSHSGMISIDAMLERLATFPDIDYKKLALYAKSLGYSLDDVEKIVKQVRQPYERIKLLQGTPDDTSIVEQLLELKDGSSYIRHIFYRRFTSIVDKQKLNLINSPVTVDQAIAFQRFINIQLLDDFKIPQNKKAELLMIHTIPPDDFGRRSDQLECAVRLLDKGNPFVELFKKQQAVDDMLSPLPSGPSEINGTGPAPSPREVMERALVKGNDRLFNKIAKEYAIDERTQNFIKIKTFTKYKFLNDKLRAFCHKVSSKMPVDRYADIAFKADEKEAALALATKISNSDDKLEKLISFNMFKEAAQVAKSMKKIDLANELMAKAENMGN